MTIWKESRESRYEVSDMTNIAKIELDELLYWFVSEMHKKNREQYPTKAVHKTCYGGIMRYLGAEGEPDIEFLRISHSAILKNFSTQNEAVAEGRSRFNTPSSRIPN